MALFSDPVERTPAYRAVVADVDREAAEAATAAGARPGREFRHAVWREKKRLLMMVHGIWWRPPAERRAALLSSVQRAVAEGGSLLLLGGALALALVSLVHEGYVARQTVDVLLLVAGVPLVAWAVWLYVRAAQEPWDEWDDDGTNTLT